MTHSLLGQAAIYLTAAVVAVPIAKRFGLGAVLGYLLSGVLVGPYALALVGSDTSQVLHFAEFGVVMMLFVIGLELKPSMLWQMRGPIFGLGGAQVVATLAVTTAICLAAGLAWRPALVLGMIVSCSSTALVLQSLQEKGLNKTEGGKAAFAVLLFQDISVIPMLAIVPLLATVTTDAAQPAWVSALYILAAVVLVVIAGRYALRPLFRILASTHLREVLTAAALLLVISVTLLMESVGLSPALGAFLAGVLLAESEYRHQLENDIEPFKGLLLGVFFVTVGAGLDLTILISQPLLVALGVVLVMLVKGLVLLLLGKLFRLPKAGSFIFSFSLAQVGEFAFVLISLAATHSILDDAMSRLVTAIVAITMMLTPFVLIALERVVLPAIARHTDAKPREADTIEEHGEVPVVMAGFGRFGQITGRFLRYNDVPVTVLDVDPEIIDIMGRLGAKVYYGDASRLDLLRAAGCEQAKLFVLAVDDPEKSIEIATTIRAHFPNLRILARAYDRPHFYRLRALGITDIVRETFGSALQLGQIGLIAMGTRAHQAHRSAELFRQHDEATIRKLAEKFGQVERNEFFDQARRAFEQLESTMRNEVSRVHATDRGWQDDAEGETPKNAENEAENEAT